MHIKVPKHKDALSFNRSELPQIAGKHVPDFIRSLKKSGVKVTQHLVEPKHYKPTQNEFNLVKVREMIRTDPDKIHPSISSNDSYILDGHHRWLADHNKGSKHETLTVDLPIHDLIKKAHAYGNSFTRGINEGEAYGWLNDKGSFIKNRKGLIHGRTYQKFVKDAPPRHADYDDVIGHALKKGWARLDIENDEYGTLGVAQYRKDKWTPRHGKAYKRILKAIGHKHHEDAVTHIAEAHHGWIDHDGKWRPSNDKHRTHLDLYMDHLKTNHPAEHDRIVKSIGGNYKQLNGYMTNHAKKKGWIQAYIDDDGYGVLAGKKDAFKKHEKTIHQLKAGYATPEVHHVQL